MLRNVSIIGYFGMIAGLLSLLAMRNLFSSSPLIISVQVAAFLLFLWARITFGRRSYHVVADPTEGGLVMEGPYRYIRHPIYAAMCIFTWAGVAGHWSCCEGVVFLHSNHKKFVSRQLFATDSFRLDEARQRACGAASGLHRLAGLEKEAVTARLIRALNCSKARTRSRQRRLRDGRNFRLS